VADEPVRLREQQRVLAAARSADPTSACSIVARSRVHPVVEFVPKRKDDPLASLREAFAICDA
jgi:hypothetical protein